MLLTWRGMLIRLHFWPGALLSFFDQKPFYDRPVFIQELFELNLKEIRNSQRCVDSHHKQKLVMITILDLQQVNLSIFL